MTPTQHTTSVRDFYAPAMAVTTDEPGRVERFVSALYRVHRYRGTVTARPE